MLEIIFLYSLALIWILFATIQDTRTTEVANWLNFSLIAFALGFRFFYSLFLGNFGFLYQGLIGLAIFYALGNLLYNARMFAGGDAKLFVSLGAVLPVSGNFFPNLENLLLFLLIFFVVGAVYSIATSAWLCARNYRGFRKKFRRQFKEKKKFVNLITLLAIITGISGLLIASILFYLAILFFALPYLYLYAKAVDEAAMIREVPVGNLMEGDWLYKDVKLRNRTIKATWNGLDKKEILLLRKHKKKVWIRKGVAFTPVFLISFIIFFYLMAAGLGNPFW